MNAPIPTPTTPNLEALRKAVQEFQSNSHRVPFTNLRPVHDSIVELRGKQVSYSVIAELLQQHGVKTSRARVAEYGRIVLDGGKSRKRRKRKAAPTVVITAVPQSAPADAKPSPATSTAPASNVPPPAKENSPYTSRGPRIANVRMISPEEKADLDAFLKAKDAPKS
jgi:hypothetical protein